MKQPFFYILCTIFLFCSCDDIVEKDTPENVFEVFWRTLDENYVYFEEKGIDWDSIYNVYAPQAQAARNDDDLKRIFGEIIPLFKDKHLSIRNNTTTYIRYINCEQDTLGTESHGYWEYGFSTVKIFPYSIEVDSIQRMAYVEVRTFNYSKNSKIPDLSIHHEKLLDSLECSNGLIIDLRNNNGGLLPYVYNFVSSFYTGKNILVYNQDKDGKWRNDFGSKIPVSVEGKGYVPDSVPIVILTSIYTYSAANFAVYMLKDIRQCTVIGEATGGGGGSRKDVILPNGWTLSFSCNKTFSPSGKNMEYRLEPDIYVKNYQTLYDKKGHQIREDTIAVKAIEFLEKQIR
jgi:hypothetical protein